MCSCLQQHTVNAWQHSINQLPLPEFYNYHTICCCIFIMHSFPLDSLIDRRVCDSCSDLKKKMLCTSVYLSRNLFILREMYYYIELYDMCFQALKGFIECCTYTLHHAVVWCSPFVLLSLLILIVTTVDLLLL